MLEVLNKHLTTDNTVCIVAQWISTLPAEEQEVLNALKDNNARVIISDLYKDLKKEVELPYKLTAFRSHLRGYCTCR